MLRTLRGSIPRHVRMMLGTGLLTSLMMQGTGPSITAGRTWAVSRDAAGGSLRVDSSEARQQWPGFLRDRKFDAPAGEWTTDKSGKAWVFVKDHAVEITGSLLPW